MSNEERKRPYAKPCIERVTLVGEEMAGTTVNCKRAAPPGGGGKNTTTPTPCTIATGPRCRDAYGS